LSELVAVKVDEVDVTKKNTINFLYTENLKKNTDIYPVRSTSSTIYMKAKNCWLKVIWFAIRATENRGLDKELIYPIIYNS